MRDLLGPVAHPDEITPDMYHLGDPIPWCYHCPVEGAMVAHEGDEDA